MSTCSVSVVIPARNAAATIGATLDSIRAQTFDRWEVVVVDDGSTDDTASIVEEVVSADPRFRLLSQPPIGVSAARNRAIEAARFPWLLFLDADDTVAPGLLEAATDRVAADVRLDLVHVGWATRFPDGAVHVQAPPAAGEDLFTRAVHSCPFPIHTAIVRRDLVREVGSFDTTLKTSEDWDLWIRCGRAGAQVAYVDEVLSLYCMREGSASTEPKVVLDDGLRVVGRVFAPDPRVPNPHRAYADGLPPVERLGGEYKYTSWAAGLIIARGEDPTDLMRRFEDRPCPTLNPAEVAIPMFISIMLGTTKRPDQWPELWPEVRDHVLRFFAAVERWSCSPDLAERSRRLLIGTIVEWAPDALGDRLEGIYDVDVDLEGGGELAPPPGTETIVCRLVYGGDPIGRAVLPVGYEEDLSAALREVVARDFAWELLRVFYRRTRAERDVVSGTFCRVLPRALAEMVADTLLRRHKRGCEWLERGLLRRRLLNEVFGARPVHIVLSDDDGEGPVSVMFGTRCLGRLERGPNGFGQGVNLRRTVERRFADELASAVVDSALLGLPCVGGGGLVQRARARQVGGWRPLLGDDTPPTHIVKRREHAVGLRSVGERAFSGFAAAAGTRAVAERLPILAYHSVAPDRKGEPIGRFRVTPESFEVHLRTLRDLGFYTTPIDAWHESITGGPALRGRPIAITFDDGLADFDEHAWPLLQRYGFGATVFVVSGLVGRTSEWNRHLAMEVPLMGWNRIRELEGAGVRFGSHSMNHVPLGAMSVMEVAQEARESLATLRIQLADPFRGFSYPYGDAGPIARHVVRGEGYRFGFTTVPEFASPYSARFALPRIEIFGWDGPRELSWKLRVDDSADGSA
ncbi:MAG: glycosyltransferase [Gemmatimonadota bacterium]